MSDSAVMTRASIARPEAGEYAPYYDRYISLVTGTDILGTLEIAAPPDAAAAVRPRRGRRRFPLCSR